MSQKRIRVLVVDDHPTVAKGLVKILEPEPDLEVVGSAVTGSDAVRMFREIMPDVTIMDIGLKPEMSGIEAIEAIRRSFADARIVALSALDGDDLIYRALQAGAVTYLLKEQIGDNLVSIIRQVDSGGRPISPEVAAKLADRISGGGLTPREIEVLQWVAEGLRNKEIAARIGVSQQTVEFHVKNILAKLAVSDRTKAVTVGIRRGFIRLP